jgi:hypothetical protein
LAGNEIFAMAISKKTLRGMFTGFMILFVMPSLYWGATVSSISFDDRFVQYFVAMQDVLSYVGLDDFRNSFLNNSIHYIKIAVLAPYVVAGEWLTPEGFELFVYSIDWIGQGAWPFVMFLLLMRTRAPF